MVSDTLAPAAGKRDRFYLALALAMSATVFLGFWFTYFGPLFRGVYPPVEPIVHVHGWTFFLWYLLVPTQAGLIRSGRVTVHRALGLASLVLAALMIAVGLIVSTVQIDLSLGPDGSPFWALMGVPIFSIWVLFTVFYATAIARRRRPADHKRLMVLASAVAMSAATFRILVQFLGLEPWVAVVGTLASSLFVFAAIAHDYRATGTVHRVYRWGAPAIIGIVGGMFLVVLTSGGESLKQGLAWIGRLLKPLYFL